MSARDEIRFLRCGEVCSLIGVKKTKLYGMVKSELFPVPAKLGRVFVWPDVEVSKWQASLMQQGRKGR